MGNVTPICIYCTTAQSQPPGIVYMCQDRPVFIYFLSMAVSGGHSGRIVSLPRSEVLTTLLLTVQVFWDVTPRRLVNSYRRFEKFYFFHLESQAPLSHFTLKTKHYDLSKINYLSLSFLS